MLRRLMLGLARNRSLLSILETVGRRSGWIQRFVAGESFREAVPAVKELNRAGLRVTLDLLGEGVQREEEAARATREYRQLLEKIDRSEITSSISIKLTQLGLDISRDLCSHNLALILEEARKLENFVRIDMEASRYTQDTLDLFCEHLERFGPSTVGIVIQAYLYRSEDDLKRLVELGCNVRLCKGAYMESEDVAYARKRNVDENFKKLLAVLLGSSAYAAIATHDERMISHAWQLIREEKLPPARYEFQMLYGVRRERQFELRGQGCPMRVYVPFGTKWAPYFTRRLAERPANVLFILKNLFKK